MDLHPALFAATSTAQAAYAFNFNDYLVTFFSIVLEALPFIVFGCIVSGALEELLPQRFIQKFLPKNRYLAIAQSSLMGFILPMCECGIVPVMRRLLSKGMPASCAVTYMLSAPIINPIVLWSTMLAFTGFGAPYDLGSARGVGMVLMRAGCAFVVACIVGVIFERMSQRGEEISRAGVERVRLIESDESRRLVEEEAADDAPAPIGISPLGALPVIQPAHDPHQGHSHGPGEKCDHDHHDHSHDHHHHAGHDHDHHHQHASAGAKRSLMQRITGIADIALSDFLDILAFLVLGAAIAALVRTTVPVSVFESLSATVGLSILAMMLFAFLLALCSEADAFVAANLTTMSLGSKLAFLVLGPMFDIKLLIMYRWVFAPKAVKTLVMTLLVVIFAITLVVDLVFPGAGVRQ
jgi:uncharacterized membrane protein YraQ (UPF0718 family)